MLDPFDQVRFTRSREMAIVTAAARLRVPPLELAKALEQGGIATLMRAIGQIDERDDQPCPDCVLRVKECMSLIPAPTKERL